MIKVTFYAEDSGHKTFRCKFRSEKLANLFIENYQYLGGFTRFGADIWGETEEHLPIIPCNYNGFKVVYDRLYK